MEIKDNSDIWIADYIRPTARNPLLHFFQLQLNTEKNVKFVVYNKHFLCVQ